MAAAASVLQAGLFAAASTPGVAASAAAAGAGGGGGVGGSVAHTPVLAGSIVGTDAAGMSLDDELGNIDTDLGDIMENEAAMNAFMELDNLPVVPSPTHRGTKITIRLPKQEELAMSDNDEVRYV